MVMLGSYESSQHCVTVEIGISPRMQRVLVLMDLILGFCRPQRKEDHKNDVWKNAV